MPCAGARAARRPGPGRPRTATVLVAGPGNARGDAEVRAIAALRPGASVLTGEAATPAATLAALDSAALAHLAAHGQHQAENALFSSLELAGGPLLGYDLQRAGRAPLMVVLSSCDVGLTDVRPGDETFGMVTALLNAGSATVVASVAESRTMPRWPPWSASTARSPLAAAGRGPGCRAAGGGHGWLRMLRRR